MHIEYQRSKLGPQQCTCVHRTVINVHLIVGLSSLLFRVFFYYYLDEALFNIIKVNQHVCFSLSSRFMSKQSFVLFLPSKYAETDWVLLALLALNMQSVFLCVVNRSVRFTRIYRYKHTRHLPPSFFYR